MPANTWSAKNFDFFVDLRNLPGSSHQESPHQGSYFLPTANTTGGGGGGQKLPKMIDPNCQNHGVANPKNLSLRSPASSHQDQLCASCPGQVTVQLFQKPIILCELWNLDTWWSNYIKMSTKQILQYSGAYLMIKCSRYSNKNTKKPPKNLTQPWHPEVLRSGLLHIFAPTTVQQKLHLGRNPFGGRQGPWKTRRF